MLSISLLGITPPPEHTQGKRAGTAVQESPVTVIGIKAILRIKMI